MNTTYEIASVQQTRLMAKILSTGQLDNDMTIETSNNDWAIQYLALPEDGRAQFTAQVKAHKGQTAGDGSCKNG